jgi:hypothetical protein
MASEQANIQLDANLKDDEIISELRYYNKEHAQVIMLDGI